MFLFFLYCTFRFPVDERNTQKSVVEYFYETYGFRIQHTQLPCLQVGNSNRPNYLPMEVTSKFVINYCQLTNTSYANFLLLYRSARLLRDRGTQKG